MALADVPIRRVRLRDTHRLVPSRFPTVGILDAVASPEDLDAIVALEGWTNDRLLNEVGILQTVPRDEWVVGRPMASVIMAAFCHPGPGGGRFTDEERGAWYAGRSIETAIAETVHHRTMELSEVGFFDTFVQMRDYLANIAAPLHDLRADAPAFRRFYDPDSYTASQQLGRELRAQGSEGVLYRSVRHAQGECVVAFRPQILRDVRVGGHFEYRWHGGPEPEIRRLGSP
jgi:RES domain